MRSCRSPPWRRIVAGVRALERAEAASIPDGRVPARGLRRRARSATRRWPTGSRRVACGSSCCAGYMHLLRPNFLARFPGRVVNTHSAPLPAFPGAHPIEDVLAAGVAETAATDSLVDDGIDTGAVIAAGARARAGGRHARLAPRPRAGRRASPAARGREGADRRMRRALLSVFDKTGIAAFATELVRLDFEIVASGGTAKLLADEGDPGDPARGADGLRRDARPPRRHAAPGGARRHPRPPRRARGRRRPRHPRHRRDRPRLRQPLSVRADGRPARRRVGRGDREDRRRRPGAAARRGEEPRAT